MGKTSTREIVPGLASTLIACRNAGSLFDLPPSLVFVRPKAHKSRHLPLLYCRDQMLGRPSVHNDDVRAARDMIYFVRFYYESRRQRRLSCPQEES